MQLRAAHGPFEQILRRLVPPQHKKLLQPGYPLVPGWHLKGARFAGELSSSNRPVNSVPHKEHRSQVQAAALSKVLKLSAALRGLPLLSPPPNAHGVVDNIWQLEGSGKGFYAQLKAANFCGTKAWQANGRDGWANAAAELWGLSPLSRFFLFRAFKKKKGNQPWQTDGQFSTGVSMPADSDNPDRIVLYVVKPQWAASVAGKAAGLLTFKVEDAAEQLTAEHLEQDPSQQPDVLRVCGAQAVELLAGLVRVLVTAAAECSATKSVRAAQIKVSRHNLAKITNEEGLLEAMEMLQAAIGEEDFEWEPRASAIGAANAIITIKGLRIWVRFACGGKYKTTSGPPGMTSDDCQTYQYNLACQSGKKDSNDRIPSVPVKYWDAQHRFALLLVVCGQHMLAFPACPLLEETLLRTTVNGFRRGFRSGTLAEDAFAWELPSADVPDVLRIWALMSSMMDGGAARSYEDLKLLCGAAESTDLYKMPRNRRGAKWEKVEPTAAAAAAAVAADAGAGSGAASRVSRRKRSSPRHSPL